MRTRKVPDGKGCARVGRSRAGQPDLPGRMTPRCGPGRRNRETGRRTTAPGWAPIARRGRHQQPGRHAGHRRHRQQRDAEDDDDAGVGGVAHRRGDVRTGRKPIARPLRWRRRVGGHARRCPDSWSLNPAAPWATGLLASRRGGKESQICGIPDHEAPRLVQFAQP